MSPQINEIYEFDDFRLDLGRRVLLRAGEAVPLTAKVFETLAILVQNAGRLLGKDELMKAIWPDSFVEEANLAQNIAVLRKLLGEKPGENRYIVTVPGRGYQFVARLRRVEEAPADLVMTRQATAELVIEQTDEAVEATLSRPALTAGGWPHRRMAVAAGAVVVVALLALAGVLVWRGRREAAGAQVTKSLAVLPFQALNAAPGEEYLGVGITDAIITRLSNVHRLVVRPTDAVLGYAGPQRDARKAGQALGVGAILDGTVQKSGDRIRVTVQLVQVSDGRPLWARSFDEKFTNVFAVEDSISQDIVQALALTLAAEERQQLSRHYTEDIEAYRNYLQGRYAELQFSRAGLDSAIRYFDRAIALDPGYALAYAGLADAYTTASDWILPPREALPHAEAAAHQALTIDPNLAEAHASLGHAYLHQWKLDAAGPEFDRALALNPNDTSTYFAYAEYLSARGEEDRAVAASCKALEIDPVSPDILCFMAWPLYLKHDFDAALVTAQKGTQLYPGLWVSHYSAGLVYFARRQFAEAAAEFEKASAINPESSVPVGALAAAEAAAGRKMEALRRVAELQKRSASEYVSPMVFADIYNALGERDRVFEYLERAYTDQSERLIFLKYDPVYDNLHGEARFQALLRRVQ